MTSFSVYHHTIKRELKAIDSAQLLKIITPFKNVKLWIYRTDGTWWTKEHDIFGTVIYAMISKRSVPAEFRLVQEIFG
jgi:hypothetical protein